MPARPGAGRKPKPLELHKKHGTKPEGPRKADGSRSRGELQPVLIGGRPMPGDWAEPPADLPADGKTLWRRDVQKIIEIGVADKVDTAALESLCIAYARAKQAGRVIKKEGLFTQGSVGQLREHPAVRIEASSWDRFLRLAEQFGITPIARTRLGLAELGRRTLAHDLEQKLGAPKFVPVPAQNEEDGGSGQVVDAEVVEE